MASPPEGPEPAPVAVRDTRKELAAEFLRGDGIEIGGLHLAITMPPGARVRYVDRMTVPELRAHYPELADWDLVQVDIVDDGEMLATIEDDSVDFIIANHFLEHCEDPIRTIETHLRKLRPAGILYYAVPDKRYTFDFRRPRTQLQHVVNDHDNGPEASRSEHYVEWVRTYLTRTPSGATPKNSRPRATRSIFTFGPRPIS
jgi:SAM-dependent methyltransferase